uniref:RRM domain-containing protein n=1 Tax=Panagrolaimus davidi TaxID=227884 RepID=A0A914P359_9BILA
MGNVFSNSPPEPTPLSDTSEQMPDFKNLFQEVVPKMMRVTDDLHRMVDYMYIRDLNNMMTIGLDLFIIIGILILTVGLGLLTIIGILIFLVLKRSNGKQERRGPQTPSSLPSESVKSEQNHPTTLIMNDDHTCIPNLQLNIPMPTTPTSMPSYSDSTAAAYGTPPLTTSVSTAAAGTPSVSSLINSEDPSIGRVFVGNLKKTHVSREDLVGLFKCCGNVLGATLFKGHALIQFSSQTEAELCVQTLNGYTWEGSELIVKILTLYSKNDAIDHSNVSQNFSNILTSSINNNNKGSGAHVEIRNSAARIIETS